MTKKEIIGHLIPDLGTYEQLYNGLLKIKKSIFQLVKKQRCFFFQALCSDEEYNIIYLTSLYYNNNILCELHNIFYGGEA